MISGIVTAILLASYAGITAWAWSSRQRERFNEASRLPLDDEDNQRCQSRLNREGRS